ncbi:hypothetical protein D1872_215860 [compost metagenome]
MVGSAQLEFYSFVVDFRNRLNIRQLIKASAFTFGFYPLKRVHDGIGIDGVAALELGTVPEGERIRRQIIGNFPGFSQRRNDFIGPSHGFAIDFFRCAGHKRVIQSEGIGS